MLNKLKNKIKYRLFQWLIEDAPDIELQSIHWDKYRDSSKIKIEGSISSRTETIPLIHGHYKLVRIYE